MTTAVIGTGGIGSAIARELASGGETLRLSGADRESARTLAAEIGRGAVIDRYGLRVPELAEAPRLRSAGPAYGMEDAQVAA
jgi:predicted dinucleotide-binding enzyme